MLSVLSAAAVLPLLASAIPASAEIGKEGFLIRAVNTADTSIQHTAGLIFDETSGNPTGGGSFNPNPQPAAITLATYKCGPMSYDVTDQMANLANANQALQDAGNGSQMKKAPVGWTLAGYMNSWPTGSVQRGFPTDGSKPQAVSFYAGSESTPADEFAGSRVYLMDTDSVCLVSDAGVPASDGARYSYKIADWAPASNLQDLYPVHQEGKWINEEGKLKRVAVDYAERHLTTTVTRSDPSDRYPIEYIEFKKGPESSKTVSAISVIVAPTAPVDGIDTFKIHKFTNGSTNYTFRGADGKEAKRKQGPPAVSVYSDGKLAYYDYFDASGNVVRQSNVPNATWQQSVDHYNAKTGQSWDGKLPNLNDYDQSIPFFPEVFPR